MASSAALALLSVEAVFVFACAFRSDAAARVLIINIELCTLHLAETDDLEKLLSFCLWGDGCAASLVTSAEDVLESIVGDIVDETDRRAAADSAADESADVAEAEDTEVDDATR